MTPEVGDAMTHEAHASFKDKDEFAAAVQKLKDRWIELDLSKSAVASLASRNADWSGVDIAVVHDLLQEATVIALRADLARLRVILSDALRELEGCLEHAAVIARAMAYGEPDVSVERLQEVTP